MPAQPIYLDVDEEISELIERLRRTPAAEVPVVVPARSRIGQSRFNFRLLRDFARDLGKRISIISTDSAVQLLAEETGFTAFSGMDEYGSPEAERTLALAAVAAGPAPFSAPPAAALPPPERPAPRRSELPACPRLPNSGRWRARTSGGRIVLYAGATLIALVAFFSAALLVPSATVTLSAKAQPLSDTANVDAAPNAAPVRIRAVTTKKDLSQQFKSTGIKITPAVASAGTAVYTNNCTSTEVSTQPARS